MWFDKTSANEVLMEQLPTWFKPVLEYIELMKTYGIELDDLNANSQLIFYNQFIQTCDVKTMSVWERLFGLTVQATDTVEFRRDRLLQKFAQTLPYTVWDLRARLTELFGTDYTMTVNPQACTIKIIVTSDRYGAIDLLYSLIWDVIPAHLRIYANQQITNLSQTTLDTGAFCLSTRINNIGIGES
jgi:hypothetical protein